MSSGTVQVDDSAGGAGRPADGQQLSRIARGSSLNLVGAAVSSVTNFALTIVVTRGMPQDIAGILFTTTSLVLLAASVGRLGTDTGLVYFISRARSAGAPERIRPYIRAAVRPVLVTAVLMAVALVVASPWLGRSISAQHAGLTTRFLLVLAVLIPVSALEDVALSATRGLGTMRPNATIEMILRPSVQVVMVAVAVWAGLTELLAAAWALCYLLALALAWGSLRSRLPRPAPADSPAIDVRREFWRFSAPRSVASFAQIAMQRLDIILVALIAGPAQAAVYTAATRFVVVGQMARNAVSLAVQPDVAQALHRGDRVEINSLYQMSTAWLMLVTWPIYLLLSIDGRSLLHVFGHGYAAGTAVLVLLGIAMLVATLCGDVDIMLIMAGRTSWSLANVSIALGLNVVLDLILIPRMDILGAAIGWSVAIIVKNLLALVQVAIVLHLHPLGKASLTTAGLCLATFGVVPLTSRLWLADGLVRLVVEGLVGGVLFLVGAFLLRRTLALDVLRAHRPRGSAPSSAG
jgi:O-antigen/teichoic acid export membrane protein